MLTQQGLIDKTRCRTDDIHLHDKPRWIINGEPRCDFCLGVMITYTDPDKILPIAYYEQPQFI